jgi:hypothetical protein
MRCRAWAISLLLLSVSAGSGAAQVKLEWKFKEGDKFTAKVVTSYKGKVILNGDTQDQEAENTTVFTFTVLKKTKDAFVLAEKIRSVKITSSGGTTGFPQIPLARKWQGARFTITLAPRGEITKFEGYAAALKQVANNNENVIRHLRSLFPEDALKQAAAAVFVALPNKETKKGDAWERPAKCYLPPWGTLEAANRYLDDGKVKQGERITMTAAMKYVAPAGSGAELPFKVVSGQLKAEPAKGTIVFDPAAGRLVRSETKLQFKGGLVFTTEGKNTAIHLEQEQTVVIRLQN